MLQRCFTQVGLVDWRELTRQISAREAQIAELTKRHHDRETALAQLEKPAITLAVGGKTLVAYLPLTIAERLNLFEKEGLRVTINDFAGGSRALQSLVGGSADVVCGAYEHTILTRAKGVGIKAVALQNNSFGAVIALPTEKAKSYRGPKDLVGLKIGVTAPGSASS